MITYTHEREVYNEGVEQGIEQGVITMINNAISNGLMPEEVARILNLDITYVLQAAQGAKQ